MADLTATLQACQNPDTAIRKQAEEVLVQAEKNNYSEFALALTNELASEAKPIHLRQLAGISFKNLFVAKEDLLQKAKHATWLNTDPNLRSQIKSILLTSLYSQEYIPRHTAAQACAEVAAVELPYNSWPEFLAAMTDNVTSESQPDAVKVSTLECLGFSCERIAALDDPTTPEILPDVTDKMLTAIVDGIRETRPDAIRLSAAIALRNSLLFTRKNMDNENERDMIMQAICTATTSQDMNVRAAAYECIVQIAFQYYDKLEKYMPTLFSITLKAIGEDEEKVALNAIEFWSTLCEEEMEIMDEIAECEDVGTPPTRACMNYVRGALPNLAPILTNTLTKQDEDAAHDDEIWNLSMSAATCLGLIANTILDEVVPIVMPFITAHIQSENWRFREAATMAFSSILDGPTTEVIGPYVNQSISFLLKALSDSNVMVKDTTAWTIGRICELHVRSIPEENFQPLVEALTEKLLTESAQVSSQSCYALHNLAAAFSEDTMAETQGTNALSPYMKVLLERLLQVTDREDADENNLRPAAFEAISVLIQNSAPDCMALLITLLPLIVGRLQASFGVAALTNDDKEKKEGVQGLLCGLIQVLVLKMEPTDVAPHADNVMTCLLQVLQIKNATCHQEAFSAISAVCDKLEADFNKYMAALAPFLVVGLRNFQAYQVCSIAVGLVGDISRSIEDKIAPYCNEIMSALMESLQNQYLHRSVKPPVLSSFGDVAMAIGAGFQPYLEISLMMLMQAASTDAPPDDDDLVEYVNQLREGVLEAYTGIIQGLKDGNQIHLIKEAQIESIMVFLHKIAYDPNRDEEVVSKAVGLLGDIASAFGVNVKKYLKEAFVNIILKEAYDTGNSSIQETCNWASGEIQKALQ